MLKELKENVHKVKKTMYESKYQQERQSIKRKKEILELKWKIYWWDSQADKQAEGRTSKLKDSIIEMIRSEEQKKKKKDWNGNHV